MYSRPRFPFPDYPPFPVSAAAGCTAAARDPNRARHVAMPGDEVADYRIAVMPEMGAFPAGAKDDSRWGADPPSWALWRKLAKNARATETGSFLPFHANGSEHVPDADDNTYATRFAPRNCQNARPRIAPQFARLDDVSSSSRAAGLEEARNYREMAPSKAMAYENPLNEMRRNLVEGGHAVPWRTFPPDG